MKINKLTMVCVLPLAFSCFADDQANDYNFVTVKAGFDQAKTSGSNANVSGAKSGYVAGFEVGRTFMDRFAASIEYNYYGKTNFNTNVNTVPQVGVTSTQTYSWSGRSDVLLANFSVNLFDAAKINPYVKAGLGASRNKANTYTMTDAYPGENGSNVARSVYFNGRTKTNFAWRVGAGMNIAATDLVDFDVAYSYTNRGKFETEYNANPNELGAPAASGAKTVKLADHAVTLGVKFKF